MKYTQGEYRLIRKDNLGQDLYRFVLECPEITDVAAPGQFVHILPKGSTLRRPISICQIDRQAGTLTLVFAVRGEGTAVLADLRAGDYVDMLAPLGHGFTIQPDANRVILMGGGIGVPPMLALAEIYGKRATVISGFRSMPAVMLQEEFAKSGAKTILCTDDGTAGLHAMVTEPLLEEIRQELFGSYYGFTAEGHEVLYHVTLTVDCDPENKTFYSENGVLYDRETGEAVLGTGE